MHRENIALTAPRLYPATIPTYRVCRHAQSHQHAIHLSASDRARNNGASAVSPAGGKWHRDPCHNHAAVVTPQWRYPIPVPPAPVVRYEDRPHLAAHPIVQSFSSAFQQAGQQTIRRIARSKHAQPHSLIVHW